MLVKELIEKLQRECKPDALVLVWDADVDRWEKITGFGGGNRLVYIYTDDDMLLKKVLRKKK